MSAHKILIWVEVTELFERKELSDYYANICPQMAATDQSESSILERRLLIINIWEKTLISHTQTDTPIIASRVVRFGSSMSSCMI